MVPWGTTNQDELLNDHTGSRRFWVMAVQHTCQFGWVAEHRDEIWKAVMAWLDAGMEIWVPAQSDAAHRIAERGEESTVRDEWVDEVLGFLAGTPDRFDMHRTAWDKSKPLTRPILLNKVMNIQPKDMTRAHSFRIARVMADPRITSLGWVPKRTKTVRGWLWEPIAESSPEATGVKAPEGSEEFVTPLSSDLSPQTPWNGCLYRTDDRGDKDLEVLKVGVIKKDTGIEEMFFEGEISEREMVVTSVT